MALVSKSATTTTTSPPPPAKPEGISTVSSALTATKKGPVISVVLEVVECTNLPHNNNNNSNHRHHADSHYVKIKLASSQKDVHKTKLVYGQNPRFTITQQSACCLHGMSLEQLEKEGGLLLKVKNSHGKQDVGHAILTPVQLLEHCNSEAKTLELPLDDNNNNATITISIRPTTPQSVQFYQSRKWGLFYSFSPSKAGSINIPSSHFDAASSKTIGDDSSRNSHSYLNKNSSWRVSLFGNNKKDKKSENQEKSNNTPVLSVPKAAAASNNEPTAKDAAIPAVIPVASVSDDDDNSTIATQLTSSPTTPHSTPTRNAVATVSKKEEEEEEQQANEHHHPTSSQKKDGKAADETPDHVVVTKEIPNDTKQQQAPQDPYHDDNHLPENNKEDCYHCFCMTPPGSLSSSGGECIIL